MENPTGHLGGRFEQALQLAFQLHQTQTRKGTRIPYISHLLAVTALVIEAGADEDQAIAALLHDAVEDQGGQRTLNLIRERFGERVSDIVSECSDTDETPKPPWRLRKQNYLDHLRTASEAALLVSLADKVHNARSILRDHRAIGERVWERFSAPRQDQLWYYRKLVERFSARLSGSLLEELDRTVAELDST